MAGTLLFVHGTGVRELGFTESLRVIQAKAGEHLPGVAVRGAYWGGRFGAALPDGAKSVPEYRRTGGGLEASAESDSVALWAMLYTDPLYELRLLAERPVGAPAGFGEEPPSVILARRIEVYDPSDELRLEWAVHGLADEFDHALEEVRGSAEMNGAVATADAQAIDHAQAIARAIVAAAIVRTEQAGKPPLDADQRDRLLERLTNELSGYGMGIAHSIARLFAGVAKHLGTMAATRDRGGITDAAVPAIGDIFQFQAHGEGAREFLTSEVDRCDGPVTLLGHSLGGIMCADLLAREQVSQVERLVTVGSQAGFLYEIGAFTALPTGESLPGHFPPWLNVYDRRDLLSYLTHEVFAGHTTTDVEVNNGQPFPTSHSAYWRNDETWQAIAMHLS